MSHVAARRVPDIVLVYVCAVSAGLLFGLASVIQQRVAFDAPPGMTLRPRLLWWLVRQPAWLAGVGTATVGNVLSALALSMGSVALVQPLLVSRLIFALPLSAAWARLPLQGRDWWGLMATAGGLATFAAVGHPREGTGGTAGLAIWLLAGAAIAVVTAAVVVTGRRTGPRVQAPLLGAGAGILFGLQSTLLHSAVDDFPGSGVGSVLGSPATYAVVVTALTGTLLAQSAYEVAPLRSSYPALASVEPLAAIALAVTVLGSELTAAPWLLAVGLLGLVVMTGGIYLLATSHLVAGQAEAVRRRQQEEAATRLEERLAHDLDRLERDLAPHRRPADRAEVVAAVQRDRIRVEDDLDRLRDLTTGIVERAERERPAPVPGRPDHERLMEQWAEQRRWRERDLRDRAAALERAVADLTQRSYDLDPGDSTGS